MLSNVIVILLTELLVPLALVVPLALPAILTALGEQVAIPLPVAAALLHPSVQQISSLSPRLTRQR